MKSSVVNEIGFVFDPAGCFSNYNYIESLAEKIVAHGGKQRMPVREYYPDEKPYRRVYCEDPFGNILELYSHSYELTYSAGAYQVSTA